MLHMRLIEIVKPVANRPDTLKLRCIEQDSYALLESMKYHIKNKNVDLRVKCWFLKELSNLNKTYRVKILGVKEDSRTAAITVNTYNKKNIADILSSKFGYNFTWSVKAEGEHHTGCRYSVERFWTAMQYATAILLAKYPTAFRFQLELTCYKVLLDYFDLKSIEYDTVCIVIENFLGSDYSAVSTIMDQELGHIEKPLTEVNLLPTKKDFETWISVGFTRTEIKNMVAKELGCSTKTVQRMLARYGLTRNYKK